MPRALPLVAGLLAGIAIGQTRFEDLSPTQQENLRKVLVAMTERREGTLEMDSLIATPVSDSGMLAVYVRFSRPDGNSDLIVCSLAEERVWGECVVRDGVSLEDMPEPPADEERLDE